MIYFEFPLQQNKKSFANFLTIISIMIMKHIIKIPCSHNKVDVCKSLSLITPDSYSQVYF